MPLIQLAITQKKLGADWRLLTLVSNYIETSVTKILLRPSYGLKWFCELWLSNMFILCETLPESIGHSYQKHAKFHYTITMWCSRLVSEIGILFYHVSFIYVLFTNSFIKEMKVIRIYMLVNSQHKGQVMQRFYGFFVVSLNKPMNI